jgi:hypothetical protein
MANNTQIRLMTNVYTRDLNQGIRIGERLETGMLGLNAVASPEPPRRSAASSSPARDAKTASNASRNTSTFRAEIAKKSSLHSVNRWPIGLLPSTSLLPPFFGCGLRLHVRVTLTSGASPWGTCRGQA